MSSSVFHILPTSKVGCGVPHQIAIMPTRAPTRRKRLRSPAVSGLSVVVVRSGDALTSDRHTLRARGKRVRSAAVRRFFAVGRFLRRSLRSASFSAPSAACPQDNHTMGLQARRAPQGFRIAPGTVPRIHMRQAAPNDARRRTALRRHYKRPRPHTRACRAFAKASPHRCLTAKKTARKASAQACGPELSCPSRAQRWAARARRSNRQDLAPHSFAMCCSCSCATSVSRTNRRNRHSNGHRFAACAQSTGNRESQIGNRKSGMP